jgi:hypothetical protein
MSEEQTSTPFRVEQTAEGRRVAFDFRAEKVVRQQKKGTFSHFEIWCDEGARIGGDDTAPPPLAYFAASIAF